MRRGAAVVFNPQAPRLPSDVSNPAYLTFAITRGTTVNARIEDEVVLAVLGVAKVVFAAAKHHDLE